MWRDAALGVGSSKIKVFSKILNALRSNAVGIRSAEYLILQPELRCLGAVVTVSGNKTQWGRLAHEIAK